MRPVQIMDKDNEGKIDIMKTHYMISGYEKYLNSPFRGLGGGSAKRRNF